MGQETKRIHGKRQYVDEGIDDWMRKVTMVIDPYFNGVENELYVNVYRKNCKNTIPYKDLLENKNGILDIAKKEKNVLLVKGGIGLAVESELGKRGLNLCLISYRELDCHIKHIDK